MGEASMGVTRRSFLRGTAAGALAAGTVGIGGRAAIADVAPAEPSGQAATDSTLSCDVCVIGGGAAGSMAAIQATDLGAKVILLEKTGSTGMRGDGFFVVSSPLLEDVDCDPVDVGTFFKAFMQDTSWRADGTLVRDWLEMSKGTVSYLMSHGCTFVKPVEEYSGGNSYPGGFGFTQYDTSERLTVEQMADALTCVTDAGGSIICDAQATELTLDAEGVVTGVRATTSDGGTLEVSAPSVIVASGGYNADFDWVAESYDGVRPTGTLGLATNLGDGIRMAAAVGAAERGEQAVMLRMPRLVGDFDEYDEFDSGDGKVQLGKRVRYAIPLLPMTLWVNSAGERFADENEICYNRNYCGNVVMSQGGYVYILITKAMLETLGDEGAAALGMLRSQGMGYNSEYTQMEIGWGDVLKVVDGLVGQGVAYAGESVEEVAQAAGMDPATLARTLETYNAACAAKSDDTFFKDAQYLYPMDEGPYYLLTTNVNVLCTLGGLRVDRYMRVVSADAEARTFNPIAGLYACGTCTGGFYGDHYANAEGPAQSYCYTSARTAACYAVNNALGTEHYHLDLVEG